MLPDNNEDEGMNTTLHNTTSKRISEDAVEGGMDLKDIPYSVRDAVTCLHPATNDITQPDMVHLRDNIITYMRQ